MHIPLHDPADLNELDRRITAERVALQRDRYRAVRLALDHLQTMDIAQRLGRSRDFVQTWAYAYRDGGIDAIRPGKAKGRPPKLPNPQQRAFIERFKQGPTTDDGVCTLRGTDAQRILRESHGVNYSLRGVYDLLHRHNLSCLKPRPKHRKNDPQAMRQWLEPSQMTARRVAFQQLHDEQVNEHRRVQRARPPAVGNRRVKDIMYRPAALRSVGYACG